MSTLRDRNWSFSVALRRRLVVTKLRLFTQLIMLYQVNYNRGYNTPVCATEYVHADSYDEAWVMGDCKAMYPERVFDVYPIKDAAIV